MRLKHAYIIKCERVVKDPRTGAVVEVHCTYDPETRSGLPASKRKVKGTLHWVSAGHAVKAEVRLYDRLFLKKNPDDVADGEDFKSALNPNSLERLTSCLVEPGLAGTTPGSNYQFLRQGYFCVDPDSSDRLPVFNRVVTLKDSWARIQKAREQNDAG